MNRQTRAPHVHRAINSIVGSFARAGIERRGRNLADGYDYRRMDDLLDRLAPLLATYRLNVLPRVLRRQEFDRTADDRSLCCVNLHLSFELTSARDGSSVTVEAIGEAWDESDKATAKASTAAFKTAMFQLFCIPIAAEEPDESSPRFQMSPACVEPPQGWLLWSEELKAELDACGSQGELHSVRERKADLLTGLQRERPELYGAVGHTYSKRSMEIPAAKAIIGKPADLEACDA